MAQPKLIFRSSFIAPKEPLNSTPSQSPRVLEDDTESPLVDWQLEREIQILVVILLIATVFVIGLLSRRVENVLLFALCLSGVLMALVFALFG
jgi:hypothetical protein